MFDARDKQLLDLETAYKDFMRTVRELPYEKFLAYIGEWTPRDIAAHFIGWNCITLAGRSALREGAEPFYFYDGTNDYRKVNAKFLKQFSSTDRDELLKDIASTYDVLIPYLSSIPETWQSHQHGNARNARVLLEVLTQRAGHPTIGPTLASLD